MTTLGRLHLMSRLRALKRYGLTRAVAGFDYSLRGWYYASPFYDIIEHDDFIPKSLLMSPPVLKKGKASLGKELIENRFTLKGQTLDMGATPDWCPETLADEWIEELHRFGWLKHLAALPRNQGLDAARALVAHWAETNGRCDAASWESEVMATRIIHWLEQAEWLLQDADDRFVTEFMFTLNKHANLLPKRLSWHTGGWRLIRNIKALVYLGLCLPQRQGYVLEGMDLLKDQLRVQVLDDGGHIERTPSLQVAVLDDLLDIHAVLRKAGHTPPPVLDETIELMASALAVLRYPNSSLGQFGATDADDAEEASALLGRCNTDPNPPTTFLPATGFMRLARGHSLLLIDVGTTSHKVTPAAQHASTLAFEFHVGDHPVFVNQGSCVFKPHMRLRVRQAASYNTVEVKGEGMVEVLGLHGVGRSPTMIRAQLHQEPDVGAGVEVSQDGYRHLGVQHTRRVFLSENGLDLRGEDELVSATPYPVKAYFHLHPRVKARMRNKFEVELQSPGLPPLVMKVRGGTLDIQDSSYAPSFTDHSANQTLVLNGEWRQNKCTLRWGLAKHKSEEGK